MCVHRSSSRTFSSVKTSSLRFLESDIVLPPYLSSFYSPHDSQKLVQVIIRHYWVQLPAKSLDYLVLPTLDVVAREQSAAERMLFIVVVCGGCREFLDGDCV